MGTRRCWHHTQEAEGTATNAPPYHSRASPWPRPGRAGRTSAQPADTSRLFALRNLASAREIPTRPWFCCYLTGLPAESVVTRGSIFRRAGSKGISLTGDILSLICPGFSRVSLSLVFELPRSSNQPELPLWVRNRSADDPAPMSAVGCKADMVR